MKTKFAETQADFFRIVRIRTEVFVIEQQVDLHIEQDQDDDTAMHWLVENEAGEAVACCRGLDFGEEIHIGRVAVLKSYRGQHVGALMMREIEKDPHLARFKKIVLHAQAQVEGFYASLGYTTVSEPFYEAGIRHVTMEKAL